MGKKRQSNIELLRVICMILLVVHHCVVHGGAVAMEECINRKISLLFIPVGKIAFVAFIAISTFFLVDQEFRFSKFLKIWLMVFFYSVTFAFVTYFMMPGVSKRSILASFFPIIGNAHGFAAAYLAFYLFVPFLKKIADNITKFQLSFLVILLVVVENLTQIMGSITNYYQQLYNELILFVLCYFISLYLKKYPFKILNNNLLLLCIVMFVYFMRLSLDIAKPGNLFLQRVMEFISLNINNETSIFNIIAGYALFYIFKNIKIHKINFINSIAKVTFPVLLIHDHNMFRNVIWSDIFKVQNWYYSDKFMIYLFVVVVIIFVFTYIVENIRLIVEKKLIMDRKKVIELCDKIDSQLS